MKRVEPSAAREFNSTDESGTLRVKLRNGEEEVDGLGLSIWKDATIQFKLTT